MQAVRFFHDESARYGIVKKDRICEISGTIFGDFKKGDREYPLFDVRILPPCQPSKIVCVGLNYTDHAKELKMDMPDVPVLFIKPSTSVIGPEQEIICPRMAGQLDYEGELAVIIKKKAKNLTQKEAKDFILGYTCFNDVTARDLQKKDGQWTRAKSFDTFSPLGPYIVSDIDPNNLKIETYLNDKVRQSSNTSGMIFNVESLVSFISSVMTLLPGDVIATGTPKGVGPMQEGDTVEVRIEGIGILENPVVSEKK